MQAWRAGSPQHWKKPRFPNEGLEWKDPRCGHAARSTGRCQRFPNEGLKGGETEDLEGGGMAATAKIPE